MRKDLLYHGRVMNPFAVNDDQAGADHQFEATAEAVRGGKVVHFYLEPGDGTRYNFVVTPLWAIKGKRPPGFGSDQTQDWLLVTRISGTEPQATFWVCCHVPYIQFNGQIENGWTRTLVSWFFIEWFWPATLDARSLS